MPVSKNIHFIWYQGWNNFPEKFSSNVQSVIRLNPTWKVYKWDDASMQTELKNSDPKYLNTYNSFSLLHQKIDYFRYFILYKLGGVSIDSDITAIKSFDSVPGIDTDDFIVSEKPHSKSINNATIFASKNNPILKYVIDNISTSPCKTHESNYYCIQRTTGPRAFNKLLKDSGGKITVLDKSFLEPCAGSDPYCSIKPNTVLNHEHQLSWVSPTNKDLIKVYFFVNHYKYWIILLLVIIILILLLKK